MTRAIKEGDIVLVFVVDDQTELWTAVHCGTEQKYRKRRFEVLSTPANTGDLWYLRDTEDETELAINPTSTNLDAFVKVGRADEPMPNYRGNRITHASYDLMENNVFVRCQGLNGEWKVKFELLDPFTQKWVLEQAKFERMRGREERP